MVPENAVGDRGETGSHATEVFELLGNENRLGILLALWEANEPFAEDNAVSFSELRDRVGMRDSGQFNYHLGKLEGHFVRRTADGYELRTAGKAVARALLAGMMTERPSLGPVPVDAGCPYCGSTIELYYADEQLTVRCTECRGSAGGKYPRGTYMCYSFPPAGLGDRSPVEVLEAARTFYDAKANSMVRGVCPECAGNVTTTIDICGDHATGDDGLCEACDTCFRCWAEFCCDNCGYARRSALWYRVLSLPEVIAAYPESAALRDSVPFNTLAWENPPYIDDVTEELLSRNPLRIRVTIRLEEHVLRVTVDDELNVDDVGG